MDISAIKSLSEISQYDSGSKLNKINDKGNRNETFETLFESAKKMVNETNAFTNVAEEEAMKFALGMSDNIHELQAAQQKANLSLQYTVAVRNAVIDAYKEIMNMQF